MNEIAVVERATNWRRLKALVLDSVSSPITKRVYNLGLDEFFAWYELEPRPGFTKATVSAWRVAPRGPRARLRLHQRADHCRAEAGGRGGRQRAAGAGTRRRHHSSEGREIEGCPRRQLALCPAGPEAAERSGRFHQEGTARSRDAGSAVGLRPAPVRGGGAHDEAHPAARQSVVHRGPRRQARARAHDPGADLGEGRGSTRGRRRPS